ncbi:hypothetical protein MIMGU_mgv1a023631mg, partial [Erythranthe guttata]
MANAALISLNNTLKRLVNSHKLPIVPHCKEIVEFAYEEVQSLQNFLERSDRKCSRLILLDERQIRDALCEFEDVIDSHLSRHFLSHSSDGQLHPVLFSLDLGEVRRALGNFNEALVGLSDQFIEIRDIVADSSNELKTVAILGMAGIGKTVLAREVYECPLFSNCFDFRLWVEIGPKYEIYDILLGIVDQMNLISGVDRVVKGGDGNSWKYVYERLRGRKYLIVLDDVWDINVWDCLKKLFPEDGNGSRILVTTRIEDVARYASIYGVHRVRLLDEEESWDLLRRKVFDEMPCPPELEKVGKKIAENCEGLPLTIVTVGSLLSKAEKTTKYWNEVAEKENSVFVDANDDVSKVLLRSYNYLPQRLKACFLYMGVFPRNHEIPYSKLTKLWCAEGLIEPEGWYATSKYITTQYLSNLVSKSLVMVRHKGSSSRTKTCSLHSSFWFMCVNEARKTKFFHSLNSRADGLAEGVESQRRFCVRKGVLFNVKDVNNSVGSVSNMRSLLFTGPPHQYPVPIRFSSRLLRVLDTAAVRFYEFPMEVVKLVQLRYLALTCDGNIPSSISKLWNLEYLIVLRHFSIIESSGKKSPYLPMEIWDMKELTHLQVMGSDLPDDGEAERYIYSNITTLLDVSARSCTKGILGGRIHQLKKLGLRIVLAPNDDESLSCFDHISCLHGLESFKVFVVNPLLDSKFVATPLSLLLVIPSYLRKLSLSGSGYRWEDIRAIASLPGLQVLKLRCYAFRGPEWRTYGEDFPGLHFLLIEDSDLENWRVGYRSFPVLRQLSVKHCYKLEEIIWDSYEVEVIEVVDCNSYALSWAEQMKEKL